MECNVQKSRLPVAFHFFVVPHMPKDIGTLLSQNGEPVFTDHSTVDWSGLAKMARNHIAQVVPNNVTLYIGNECSDGLDVCNSSRETGHAIEGRGDAFSRTCEAIKTVAMKDMRAGVLNLRQTSDILHINEFEDGKRPPLCGLVLTLKFRSMTQARDYLYGSTKALFSHGYAMELVDKPFLQKTDDAGQMAPFLHQWLEEQFGVVYAPECTAMTLGCTFTQ
jgi:hypothetical protein